MPVTFHSQPSQPRLSHSHLDIAHACRTAAAWTRDPSQTNKVAGVFRAGQSFCALGYVAQLLEPSAHAWSIGPKFFWNDLVTEGDELHQVASNFNEGIRQSDAALTERAAATLEAIAERHEALIATAPTADRELVPA